MAAKFGKEDIVALIRRYLPFEPTSSQAGLIEALVSFILRFREDVGFVLKGYAGTGKTSVVSALVRALPSIGITPVLLAPTGRAAKVLAGYAGQPAYTIHKKIYYAGEEDLVGNADREVRYGARASSPASFNERSELSLKQNRHRNTLFIVDEASMMGEDGSLLFDFFRYLQSGYRCRVLLLGDTAQLPPVGSPYSPALDLEYLALHFPAIRFYSYSLTEVVRQGSGSLVLENATLLRQYMACGRPRPQPPAGGAPFHAEGAPSLLPLFDLNKKGASGFLLRKDLLRLSGEDLEDILQREYTRNARENVVVITRSNKRANQFNNEIRNRIFGLESDLAAGDLLMVTRNNYFWLPKESKAGFIANGDMLEVMKIRHREEMYGFHFADIEARLVDYPDEPYLEFKVMEEALHVDAANLPYSEMQKLRAAVAEDYAHLPTKAERMQALREDPYYNALQVKYAYSLTCHKTQGGQWPVVLVDQGYFTEDMLNTEYLRWLYTALTRTTSRCYLLNFADIFFQ